MIDINLPAPDFELPALDGRLHCLSRHRGRVVIVDFWSCECPQSERTDRHILAKLAEWGNKVALLTIASNRNESAEAVKNAAEARSLPMVLVDADCVVANLFNAQTTPHVFVVDRAGVLRYRGAVDNVTFRQRMPARFFLSEAVECLLEGHLPTLEESPVHGCTIVREI